MRNKLIIIDDFYANPGSELESPSSSRIITQGFHQQTKSSVVNSKNVWLTTAFSSILGSQVKLISSFQETSTSSTPSKTKDSGMMVCTTCACDWTALVFLAPGVPTEGGLSFLRNREHGIEGPPNDEQARNFGYASGEHFFETAVLEEGGNLSRWEVSSQVAPIHNRLILFRGIDMYHAHMQPKIESNSNYAITQKFLLNATSTV